ncbi:hypothetical protein RND81_10G115000 [Saponaria officinalis]|uniref:RING-type E3 ubiquitin transferase n=1 Tax=Saponaria officinalis TaxID=3572 RepID=A0AAW1I1C1_SAPOF
MSQISDLLRDTPELRRTRIPTTTRLPGTTPLSPLSLSDSEPEPDFDIDVDAPLTLEPLFSAFPEDIHHHHHHHHHHHRFHQHDVSFTNNFSHRAAAGPQSGPYFGPGWGDPQRYGLSDGGERGSGGSGVNLELGLGFGLGSSSQSNNYDETHRFEGLRVVNLDSGSDSEDGILREFDYDYDNNDNNNQGFGGVSDFDRPPFCWDYLGFNNRNRDHVGTNNITEENDGGNGVDDEFLYDGGDEGEGYSVVDEGDNVDTGVSILFDAYQEREEQREIIIESDDDQGGEDLGVEDAIRDLEWEILMAVNNFNREVYDMDFNVDMYEAILGEVEDRMNEWRGSPPASEAVIHNLPSVKLSNAGGLKENEVVCTICRDEVLGDEVVRQLPCLHYYHGDCIVPWLKIRNTCPVCRYELPTDDAEYECRKREREGGDVDLQLTLDSQVSYEYDYHVFL